MDYSQTGQKDTVKILPITADAGGMLLQLNSDDIILSIKDMLEGKIRDKGGEVIMESEPLLSERLKASVLHTLNSNINRSVVLSDLEESDVMNMTKDLMIAVLGELVMSSKEIFGDSDTILINIENIIYATLRRALHGKERESARTQMQDISQSIREDKPKREKQEGNWLQRRS